MWDTLSFSEEEDAQKNAKGVIPARHDFGMGFSTCSICKASRCLNRGCKDTKRVICQDCWPDYLNCSDSEEANEMERVVSQAEHDAVLNRLAKVKQDTEGLETEKHCLLNRLEEQEKMMQESVSLEEYQTVLTMHRALQNQMEAIKESLQEECLFHDSFRIEEETPSTPKERRRRGSKQSCPGRLEHVKPQEAKRRGSTGSCPRILEHVGPQDTQMMGSKETRPGKLYYDKPQETRKNGSKENCPRRLESDKPQETRRIRSKENCQVPQPIGLQEICSPRRRASCPLASPRKQAPLSTPTKQISNCPRNAVNVDNPVARGRTHIAKKITAKKSTKSQSESLDCIHNQVSDGSSTRDSSVDNCKVPSVPTADDMDSHGPQGFDRGVVQTALVPPETDDVVPRARCWFKAPAM